MTDLNTTCKDVDGTRGKSAHGRHHLSCSKRHDDRTDGYWWLDHLFLDQEGVPTLVETKLETNSELRRKVVGQMLDYASQCSNEWSAESIQNALAKRCTTVGKNPDDELVSFLGQDEDITRFWRDVDDHLRSA